MRYLFALFLNAGSSFFAAWAITYFTDRALYEALLIIIVVDIAMIQTNRYFDRENDR